MQQRAGGEEVEGGKFVGDARVVTISRGMLLLVGRILLGGDKSSGEFF